MDFEAIRARVDDVVTGIAADVTESIITVVDDVLTMVEDAKAEAESYQHNININGNMSPEKIAEAVQDIINRTGVRTGGTEASKPKSGGRVEGILSEEELVRHTYRYLTQNHASYVGWSQEYEDYNATSQWVSDKTILFEDMVDLLNNPEQFKRKPE